jgi:hypothetical protein
MRHADGRNGGTPVQGGGHSTSAQIFSLADLHRLPWHRTVACFPATLKTAVRSMPFPAAFGL